MLTFLRKKMKLILIIVAVVFGGSIFYGLGYMGIKGTEKSRPNREDIAYVNGRKVDKFRFNQMMNRFMSQTKSQMDPINLLYVQSMAISQLIDFTIIEQEAKRNVNADDEEIKRAVSDIMRSNKIKDEKTFEQILKGQGFSLADLKSMIKGEILVQKMIAKIKNEVTLTGDDMREIKVQHILIGEKQKDLAQKVLKDAKGGEDFSSLAIKYSIDKSNAQKGGVIDFFGKGQMVEEFEKAAFALKINEISELVRSPFGYHIIKMNESKLKKGIDKDKILNEKKDNTFNRWFLKLRTNAKIEILAPELRGFSKSLRGDFAGAAVDYQQAVKDSPSNAYAHILLADIYSKTGSREESFVELKRAGDVSRADPNLHIYIGKAFMKMSKNTDAKNEFLKASIVAGENRVLHENLAKIFKGLKMNSYYRDEIEKINRIKVKEKFENEIRKQSALSTFESEGKR